jgi:hypothetical protein
MNMNKNKYRVGLMFAVGLVLLVLLLMNIDGGDSVNNSSVTTAASTTAASTTAASTTAASTTAASTAPITDMSGWDLGYENSPQINTPIIDWSGWNLGHENRFPRELVDGSWVSNQKTQTWQGCAAQCEAQENPSFVFVTAKENVGDCSCYEHTQLNVSHQDNMTTFMVGTKGTNVSNNDLYQCLAGTCGDYKVGGSNLHLADDYPNDFLYETYAPYTTHVNEFQQTLQPQ